MSVVKQVALSICVTMVIASIVSAIAPSGRMQGIFKYFISLFFITSIILPFTEINNPQILDLDYNRREIASLSYAQDLTDQTLSLTKNLLKEKLNTILENNDISPSGIDLDIHTDKDNNIYISNLIFTLDTSFKEKESEISGVIEREAGVKAQFNYIN